DRRSSLPTTSEAVMSIEPQALERSVLERKDREELAAIAEAMGTKPAARASKATIINTILREAGIETGEDQPKRSRAKADPKTDAPATDASANGAEPAAASPDAPADTSGADAAVDQANGQSTTET